MSAEATGGRLGYRPWRGTPLPSIRRWWPIARTGIRQVFVRKIIWAFLALGFLNFLFHFAIVYFVANLKATLESRGTHLPRFVDAFVFTGTGKSFRDFISLQGVVVMLLLSFCGTILVGNDFRFRSIGFYLSKPIGKLHYFLGKLAAASLLTALITLLPAVILFAEYGAFTDSLDYYWNSQHILWSILGYAAIVSVVSATVLLGLSALFEKTLPILVAWGALFVLLPGIAELLADVVFRESSWAWLWRFLDFWRVLGWVSNVIFELDDPGQPGKYLHRLPWAVLVLCAWMTLSLAVFWRRVQAVRVVR